jgi:hypothetical protein
VLAIQLSAIIYRHDEINFHDGQVKFDLTNLDEDRRSIFPGDADTKQSDPATDAKNNTKKMPIV